MSLTPIKAIDTIDQLPGELAARLAADDYFCDIPVIVADPGNVLAQIAAMTAMVTEKKGKRGVCVIVLQMTADDDYPEVTFGPLTLKPAFQVIEVRELNLDTNGTGKSWRKVARRIRDVICSAEFKGLCSELIADKPCIEPIQFANTREMQVAIGGNAIGGQVTFSCQEKDDEILHQCSMPIFAESGVGQSIIMTCATVGVVIWFTTDGSFPCPQNAQSAGTAQVYTDPVPVPDNGFTVRAAAYMPGWIASAINRQDITVEFTL
jgi:hypothetical protein